MVMRLRLRLCLAAACVAVPCALAPVSKAAVSFGIGDSPSKCASWGANACNTWGYGFASFSSSGSGQTAFTKLKARLPLTYVRLFAPYDSVKVYDAGSGACRYSYDYTSHTSSQYPSGGGPGSAWFRLAQELRDAQAVGLTPLVAFTQATSDGQQQDGVPATPDPSAADASGANGTTTVAGHDYSCGVSGLTYLAHTAGLPIGEWEAWNEPDGSPAYNGALNNACGSLPNNCGGIYDPGTGLCGATTYTQCGPLEAAGLHSLLLGVLNQWQAQYGWAVPPVAAGTFSWPSLGYFNAYRKQLTTVIGQWPAYWSFHSYADVTSGQYVQTYAFTKDLYNAYATAGKPQPAAWITETGVVLTDHDRSYNNLSITCTNGEADDADMLGACVDANPSAQRSGAQAFLNLGTNGAYAPGQITQAFWYQFQPDNADTGWDSGLLAPPQGAPGTWSQRSPDGVYGSNAKSTGLRGSYCVLARVTSLSCSSATEGSDWSIQPRTVTGSVATGQTSVTEISGDQSLLANGDFVTGTGIPHNTEITAGAGTGSWTLSSPALTTATESLTASG